MHLLQEAYSLVQYRFRDVDLQRRVPDNGRARSPSVKIDDLF